MKGAVRKNISTNKYIPLLRSKDYPDVTTYKLVNNAASNIFVDKLVFKPYGVNTKANGNIVLYKDVQYINNTCDMK